jgi:hypothetical protein
MGCCLARRHGAVATTDFEIRISNFFRCELPYRLWTGARPFVANHSQIVAIFVFR